jgi:predicted nucleic acid-binding Zn ribbon protein
MAYDKPVSKISDVMSLLVKELGLTKPVEEFNAVQIWSGVVGEHIAKVSEVEKILHGVLYVKVKNSAWRSELNFKKTDIRQQLNGKIGKELVKDIVFK